MDTGKHGLSKWVDGVGLRASNMHYLEMNGGQVISGETTTLYLPPTDQGYTDAQIDDYRGRKRSHYPHQPAKIFSLSARFSHPVGKLLGTAGFGFWNAPFGDPTVPWPALPRAIWFFYASAPNDLPLAPQGPGQGWFAATLDATTWTAWALAPFAPLVLALNQLKPIRRTLWPRVQKGLGIHYQQLDMDITAWHDYVIQWGSSQCVFQVDGRTVLQTTRSPSGPLGFVCWLDNQYMVVTARGRFRWGTLAMSETQWLAIRHLSFFDSPI